MERILHLIDAFSTTRIDLPAEAFVDRSMPYSGTDGYCQWLHALRSHCAEHIDALYPSSSGPNHVLYPLSAYGLTDALAVFPNADTYLLIDKHPFLNHPESDREHPIFYEARRGLDPVLGNVEHAQHILNRCGMEGGMLPLLLGRMRAVYPDAVFHSARVFWGHPGALQLYQTGRYRVQPNHGLLTFSLSPDARTQRALYLNTFFTPMETPHIRIPSTRWNDAVPAPLESIDGILIKGAQSLFLHQDQLRQTLLEPLHRNEGVLVEGRAEISAGGYFELSMLPDDHGLDQTYVDFNLSYLSGMLVTSFAPIAG